MSPLSPDSWESFLIRWSESPAVGNTFPKVIAGEKLMSPVNFICYKPFLPKITAFLVSFSCRRMNFPLDAFCWFACFLG
jgi:hypothetical protein